MNKLPVSTVKLITSTQVITSIYSVVKELVENSLDAGADSIDVKLEKNGMSKIEVQDNGTGISSTDIEFLCKPHYTSKIKDDSDILNLSSYGFRGEAVHSLCTVSDITVTTKTKDDFVSQIYIFNSEGDIAEQKPSHHNIGTIISVGNLFKNIPVRRQIYNKSKKIKEELKHVEELLMSYGLLHPTLRITLRNDKNIIWRKNRTSNYSYAISEILGTAVNNNFTELNITEEKFDIKAFVPKKKCNVDVITRGVSDRTFIFVNDRPVVIKELKTVLKSCFNACHTFGNTRWPMAVVYIKVNPQFVDVNLEPNKTVVLLHDMEDILEKTKIMLESLYTKSQSEHGATDGDEVSVNTETFTNTNNESIILPNNTNNVAISKNDTENIANKDAIYVGNLGSHCGTTDLTSSMINRDKDILSEETLGNYIDDSSSLPNIEAINMSNADTVTNLQVEQTRQEILDGKQDHKSVVNIPEKTFDLEEWSRGNTDFNICTPVKVIQNDNSTEGKSEKRKENLYQPTCVATSDIVVINNLQEQVNENVQSDASEGIEKRNDDTNRDDDMSFDQEVWSGESTDLKCMSVNKVLQNENCAKVQAKKRKVNNDGALSTKKVRRNSSVGGEKDRDQMTLKTAGMKLKKCLDYEVETSIFQFKEIQENYNNNITSSNHQAIQVIGKIPSTSLWTVVIHDKLFVLDNARLSEKLLFDKLVKSHKFSAEKLQQPWLLLTCENLGANNFEQLLSMEIASTDPLGRTISDPHLTKNGIIIKCSTDSETGKDVLEWTHSAKEIPNYGISDLIEILEEAKAVNETYRPKKIKEWCKEEARRLSQFSPEVSSFHELEEGLLELRKSCNVNFEVASCLHNRSIMVPLKSLK